ncbi:MAG: LysR family transcriptional regulator [Cypionkella sp.]|uniref:LysR substrate-binding domain-containing protein n=1 Tax=Cypionkella sp. TaxID=2811411 RepID=UPI00262A20F2|nr:LysR substrate-binding domain-containing protein [Cypionkella sp.]MDB5660127.1 LysR family transcriptional regulator [Cypionkella sp.]
MELFPPLNALRAFSIAAREGSFVSAAVELAVTPAAISQHVRNLEGYLGKKLFLRQRNKIELTEAGQALYPRLEQCLGEIARLSEEVRQADGKSRLVVSASPSLAELWLYDRMRDFDLRAIEVRVEIDPVDFIGNGIDLRITYGADLYPEHRVVPLFSDVIAPVCSPEFAARWGGDLLTLPDDGFIHTDWGPSYANLPSWRAWFNVAGMMRDIEPSSGLRTHLTGHAIASAAAGLGVALAPTRLAERDIKAGRLVMPHAARMAMESSYCAIYPHARGTREPVQRLIALLLKQSI